MSQGEMVAEGKDNSGWIDWLLGSWRPWTCVILLGSLLYLPGLGSQGLWDPWEPHYAEVAREMVESGNWLEPTWEHSSGQPTDRKYFFSKPPLSMWFMAAAMSVFETHAPDGAITHGAEWWLRLPFALCAIGVLLAVFALGRRFFGAGCGFLAAVVLGTCPMFYFIARQAMTDMPLLAFGFGGTALLLLGAFSDRTNSLKVYLGWALLGLSILAKGLNAVVLAGLCFFVFLAISGELGFIRRVRLISGCALMLLVSAPYLVYLSVASAVKNMLDDEGKTFFQRFFLHDHLFRIGSGVHGDRGTFAYFLQQLGIGTHPWAPMMAWSVVEGAFSLRRESKEPPERVELFLWLYVVCGFALFSFSMTKFHHYILPVLPAAALLAARRIFLWREGERRGLTWAAMLLVVLGVAMISRDIALMPKELVDLFVYNYTRPFPEEAALAGQIGFGVIFGLVTLALIALFFSGPEKFSRWLAAALSAGALAGALWGGVYFFNAMAPHWSQRHLFDTYFALRGPEDPVGAFLMNWRGETFYSRNTVVQLRSGEGLRSWLDQHAGKRRFVLVEQHRLQKLKEKLSAEELRSLKILDRSNNKFFLVSVDARSAAPAQESG